MGGEAQMKRYNTTARDTVVKAGWTARARVDLEGATVGWFWTGPRGDTVASTEADFLKSAGDVMQSSYWGAKR